MARGPAGIFRRIIQLVVDAEAVRKAKAAMQDALNKGTDATGLKRNLSAVDKAFTKLKVGALALGAAIGSALALGLRKVIGESIEMQKILAQQEAVLRSTGEAAGRTARQLQEQANALQKLTTFTDDQVTSAQNLLLTFRNLREEEFDQAVERTLDLATAMGTDATQAALQLGKALNDPILGLTALRRSGISFSQQQSDVIKKLVETGRVAEAQRMILAELEVQFGGSAEAARNTLGGALEGLKNAWGDLFEVSREGSDSLIRGINAIAGAIEPLAGIVEKSFGKLFEFWDWWEARKRENSFSARLDANVAQGGMGDVRRAEGADSAAERRRRTAAAVAEAQAEEGRRAAAEAAAEAAEKEAEARKRAEEQRLRALVAAHELGIATVEDTRLLLATQADLTRQLQQGNLELEERVRLTQMQREAEGAFAGAFPVGERAAPTGEPPRLGRIPFLSPDQIKPIEQGAVDAAVATENAWLEAFESIKSEGEALALILGEVMAGTGESLMEIIRRIAPAKAKENFVRAIEAAGAGLARFVLYGDGAALTAGGKAAALHTAAGIGWQGFGGGGGGRPTAGGFAAGAGGVGTVGRSADRTQPQQTIVINNYIDGIDPKNGVHQQKVGLANVFWQQRQSPNGRPRG